MLRRSSATLLTLLLFLSGGQTALFASFPVLCIGSQGHSAIESASALCGLEGATTTAQLAESMNLREAESCTDYPIALSALSAPARSEAQSFGAPVAISIELTALHSRPIPCSETLALARSRTSPRLASPALLRC